MSGKEIYSYFISKFKVPYGTVTEKHTYEDIGQVTTKVSINDVIKIMAVDIDVRVKDVNESINIPFPNGLRKIKLVPRKSISIDNMLISSTFPINFFNMYIEYTPFFIVNLIDAERSIIKSHYIRCYFSNCVVQGKNLEMLEYDNCEIITAT